MKKILIIAHFCEAGKKTSNNRFDYLFHLLKKEGYVVKLITSDFSHKEKRHRIHESEEDVELISEPRYKKNVSIKRFYSHKIFSKNVENYLLKNEFAPDLVYCAVPSLDVGVVAAKYCEEKKVNFFIDIQDLWPEAFEIIIKNKFVNKILFAHFRKQATYIYKHANGIISISQTNLMPALKVNHVGPYLKVFLGSDLEKVKLIQYKNNDNDEFRLVYIGMVGKSYDLEHCIYAMKKLENSYRMKLVIIGDGPKMNSINDLCKNLNIDMEYHGFLSYENMINIMQTCDIALNPFIKNAEQSVPNKLCDYTAIGLPILNTLDNEECRNLIEEFNLGRNAICENTDSITKELEFLLANKKEREEMSTNCIGFSNNYFDRKKTYLEIIDFINMRENEKDAI